MAAFSSVNKLGLVLFAAVSVAAARYLPPQYGTHGLQPLPEAAARTAPVNSSSPQVVAGTPPSPILSLRPTVPIQEHTIQLLIGPEGLLRIPIPSTVASNLPKGVKIFAPVYFPDNATDLPGKLPFAPGDIPGINIPYPLVRNRKSPPFPFPFPNNWTAPAPTPAPAEEEEEEEEEEELVVDIQLLVGPKGLIDVQVRGESAERLPEDVHIFSPVYLPEEGGHEEGGHEEGSHEEGGQEEGSHEEGSHEEGSHEEGGQEEGGQEEGGWEEGGQEEGGWEEEEAQEDDVVPAHAVVERYEGVWRKDGKIVFKERGDGVATDEGGAVDEVEDETGAQDVDEDEDEDEDESEAPTPICQGRGGHCG
jgi:hypothetical protein